MVAGEEAQVVCRCGGCDTDGNNDDDNSEHVPAILKLTKDPDWANVMTWSELAEERASGRRLTYACNEGFQERGKPLYLPHCKETQRSAYYESRL